jgi:GNAT superfamily N-acetyltransferase
MADEVRIKQFELSEQEALLSFLGPAYPDEPRKRDAAFWKWHYLENPYTSLDDIPLWVVKSGEQIIGQLATIPVELMVAGKPRRAIWILDFIVHENFRGRGLGKRLVLAARDWCPTMITLGINEQSTGVFRSLNWAALGAIHRYQRLLFPGHATRAMASSAAVRELTNLSYAPARALLGRMIEPGRKAVRELTDFDESFDEFWARASNSWTCAVSRHSGFLDWQFKRQPGKRFEVLGIHNEDSLAGYVVLFFRKSEAGAPPKAAISDLCYAPDDADGVIDDLLKASLRLALARRVGSLVIDVRDRRIEERLRHYGFWQISKSPRFMACAADQADLLYEPGNWYLTRGDSDMSIFEESNI